MRSPGYWRRIGASDPYFENFKVYECLDGAECLGGRNATCGEGHDPDAPLCSVCLANYYKVGNVCYSCKDGSGAPQGLIKTFFSLVAIAIFGILYMVIKTDLPQPDSGKRPNGVISSGPFRNILIGAAQIMSALYSLFSIPWPESAKSLFRIFDFFNFDAFTLPYLNWNCISQVSFYEKFEMAVWGPFIILAMMVPVVFIKILIIKVKTNNDKDKIYDALKAVKVSIIKVLLA